VRPDTTAVADREQTPEEPLLAVTGLQASYGPKRVVYGVDFEVRPGEVFGTHRPDLGTVRYKGADVTGRRPARNVRDGMTMVRAERFTFGELTVRENLQLAGMSIRSGAEREARLARVYELLPILQERVRQQAGKFSGGQQRLLSLGMALLADPNLIILDEPSLGIAPSLTARIFDTVKDLVRERGLSVLIVEQNIPQLLRIVDRVYVIRSGRVILEEDVERMRARDQYWDLF
jgi:branched-chain amino acid transport system ATP-binding protein